MRAPRTACVCERGKRERERETQRGGGLSKNCKERAVETRMSRDSHVSQVGILIKSRWISYSYEIHLDLINLKRSILT